MELNKTLIPIFNQLAKVDSIKKTVTCSNNKVEIKDLVTIDEKEILLNGSIDVEENILTTTVLANNFDTSVVSNFLNTLSPFITRLNHVGIGYSCNSISDEITKYKKELVNSSCKIYEEDSGASDNRWFFIGDVGDWQAPLFEITLTESNDVLQNDWTPHFQIDIDTSLSFEEIKQLSDKHLREGFITWTLDIPNYGVVLAMGNLGKVRNTKIYLGIGTKLRNTEYHRKHVLKPV